ncbi:hypothetical protein ACS0TY_032117 [Phlomoides rotata]
MVMFNTGSKPIDNLDHVLYTTIEAVSLPDQLEGATNYIKMLQAKLEEMKQKKTWLMQMPANLTSSGGSSRTGGRLDLPNIDIRVMGSALELVLITGLNCQFMFNEIIRMLHEGGAEFVNASFSVLDNTIFHTIHSKIGESAQDYGAARISERLRKFVHDFS